MEEKRKNLISSQQKRIISEAIAALNESHPSFYYLSTIEIAAEIKKYFHAVGRLSVEEFELVNKLSRRDIQILLSLHERKAT
jgi:hypothetical protein